MFPATPAMVKAVDNVLRSDVAITLSGRRTYIDAP